MVGIRVWIRALSVLPKPKGRERWEHERQLESLMRNRRASVFSIPSVWLQPMHVNLSSHFLFSHLIYCQLLYQPLRHTHTVSSAGLPPPCSFYMIAQLLASSGIPWCSVSSQSLPIIDILTSLFLSSSLIKLSVHIRALRISTSTFHERCGGRTSLLICIMIIRILDTWCLSLLGLSIKKLVAHYNTIQLVNIS